MCDFISHIECKGDIYFIQNSDLDTKQGKKLLDSSYVADLNGHGAIRHYYPELKWKGIDKECTDFSTPDNFPKEIVKAIKDGQLSRLGICIDVLNLEGRKKYEAVTHPALKKYDAVRLSAWKKYEAVTHPALKKYDAVRLYVLKKYDAVRLSAWKKYEATEQSAWKKYEKVRQPAWKKYEKVEQSAFSQIVSQRKCRKTTWK